MSWLIKFSEVLIFIRLGVELEGIVFCVSISQGKLVFELAVDKVVVVSVGFLVDWYLLSNSQIVEVKNKKFIKREDDNSILVE